MTEIKPLFVTTQDTGGAANSALRLQDALKIQGVDAKMLTYYKRSRRQDVTGALDATSGIEKLWLRGTMRYNSQVSEAYRVKHNAMWSSNLIPNPLHNILNRSDANLLHFHWIGTGFLPLASF